MTSTRSVGMVNSHGWHCWLVMLNGGWVMLVSNSIDDEDLIAMMVSNGQ